MNKNDIFELEITDMGVAGEGIGHCDGMTFFVKDAIIGDVVKARCLKMKKNFGYARLEAVLKASEDRVDPQCALHRQCGGCQIQAMSYERQLRYKNEKVYNNLTRLGGFDGRFIRSIMLSPVGMEYPYRYRNKAQFPVGRDRDGNIVTGFYASRTHSIVPVEDCMIGVEENAPILRIVKGWMERFGVLPYEEKTQQGLVRHVLIRFGFTTKEIMVCLVVNGRKIPHSEALVERLKEIKGMTSISININQENTNKILGNRTICIWGQPYIADVIHLCRIPQGLAAEQEAAQKEQSGGEFGVRSITRAWEYTGNEVAYHISPQSFYQVNPVQTEKLYSTALDFAGLTGSESVWDLYCGIGTISLFLSRKARQVYGVEIVPQAIEDARKNAKLNGIKNVRFFVGKAEEVLPDFYAGKLSVGKAAGIDTDTETDTETGANTNVETKRSDDGCVQRIADEPIDMSRPDVIVVDPPRKGCDERCLETMVQMEPEKIVYVSCDSATLARDLKYLCENGYELRKAQVFDQFAHSGHVETIALIQRVKS